MGGTDLRQSLCWLGGYSAVAHACCDGFECLCWSVLVVLFCRIRRHLCWFEIHPQTPEGTLLLRSSVTEASNHGNPSPQNCGWPLHQNLGNTHHLRCSNFGRVGNYCPDLG